MVEAHSDNIVGAWNRWRVEAFDRGIVRGEGDLGEGLWLRGGQGPGEDVDVAFLVGGRGKRADEGQYEAEDEL